MVRPRPHHVHISKKEELQLTVNTYRFHTVKPYPHHVHISKKARIIHGRKHIQIPHGKAFGNARITEQVR